MMFQETINQIQQMEIRGAGRIARAAVKALVDYSDTLPQDGLSAWQQNMMILYREVTHGANKSRSEGPS